MPQLSERSVRIAHTPLHALIALCSLITLAIAASLVSHYNSVGYPFGNTGRDRIRIELVAAVWMSAFALFLTIGMIFRAASVIVGVLIHVVALGIGFILLIIGTSTVTAMLNGVNCGAANFSRCNIVKGLRIIGWIDTILVGVALIFVLVVAFKARTSIGGVHKATLVDF